MDEDIEVRQCIRNRELELPQLNSIIHEDMVGYIKDEIKPNIVTGCVDQPRWMDTDSGEFIVKSVF